MSGLDAEGRRTGFWEEPDPHGGGISGDYVDGKRSGLWRHRFGDGAVRSEMRYDGGELSGECVWYRKGGGLLQRGGFLAGEKHGFWQRFTSEGTPIDEGEFDRGTKSGKWTYFNPDGSVRKVTAHRGRG